MMCKEEKKGVMIESRLDMLTESKAKDQQQRSYQEDKIHARCQDEEAAVENDEINDIREIDSSSSLDTRPYDYFPFFFEFASK